MSANVLEPKEAKCLLDYSRNVASQRGEDGIVERIFEILGIERGWSVEFGGADGKRYSNTRNLLVNGGWSGVFIEGDPQLHEQCVQCYAGRSDIHCLNRWVNFEGPDSLDSILAETPVPRDFDLLSIDINGADYHVWNALQDYRPKVVIIEYNPTIHDDITFIQPRDINVSHSNSVRAIVELGRKKSYELIATTCTNALFVLSDLYPQFGIEDNSLAALRQDHRCETYLFQLQNGRWILHGNGGSIWSEGRIHEELLQIFRKGYDFKQRNRFRRFLMRKMWRYISKSVLRASRRAETPVVK